MQIATPAPEKAVVYDPETRDFALYLDGELVGWARSYKEGEDRLDELAYSRLSHQQPAIAGSAPVEASAVDAVLAQRDDEARREQIRAEALADAEGQAFAAAQRRAIGRARGALARAVRTTRTLAAELLDGSWQIAGSQGDLYTVTRAGLSLSCSCPHGDRLRAAALATARGEPVSPPRGVCWHTVLIPAIEEATDERAAERDAAAEALATFAHAA